MKPKLSRNFFWFALLGIVFTGAFTWPYASRLGTFYTDYGDFALNGWILWYNQLAIRTGRILSPHAYFTSKQMFPLPYTLCYSEHQFVPSLIFSPISWILHNQVLSVNCFIFLTLVLSFLTSAYAIYYFVKNMQAAIVGAIIYTFNPLTFAYFPTQIQLLDKYFLPLVFLYAYQYFKEPKFKNGFLFFLFFTLNALSVIYFEIFTIVALPLFFLPFFYLRLKAWDKKYFLDLAKYGAVFLVFVPFLLYFNLPYLQFAKKEAAVRSLDVQRQSSARLVDWINSNRDSWLYGGLSSAIDKKWISGGVHPPERTLFPDILPVVLTMLGMLALFREKKDPELFWGASILLVSAFLFTLGPYFLGWSGDFGTVRMPFYYLEKLTPILGGIRVPSRFQYIFYVPFSLFAAYGAARLLHRWEKFRVVLLLAAVAILFAENYVVRDDHEQSYMMNYLAAVKDNRYRFLENKNTFHFPTFVPESKNFGFERESVYLDWDTATGENMLNGYSGYLPYDWINFLTKIQSNFNEQALLELKGLDLNFVVIHKNLLGEHAFESFYDRHKSLYDQGKTYEDNHVLILDLSKYNFPINYCNFPQDFGSSGLTLYTVNGVPDYYEFKLKNKQDCYLFNRFEDRFRRIEFYLDRNRYDAYIKLPLVIEPGQETPISGWIGKPRVLFQPVSDFPVKAVIR